MLDIETILFFIKRVTPRVGRFVESARIVRVVGLFSQCRLIGLMGMGLFGFRLRATAVVATASFSSSRTFSRT